MRPVEQRYRVGVRDRYGFRTAGGAGGVDTVCQLRRAYGMVQVFGGLPCNRLVIGIHTQYGCARRGQPLSQRLLGQHHRGLRIFEHEAEALVRIGRVERNICSAGFEHAEQRDQ